MIAGDDKVREFVNRFQISITRREEAIDQSLELFETIARETAAEPALAALAQDCAGIARWMRDEASLDDRLAGSVPFCTMAAVAVAGWQLTKQVEAVAAGAAPEVVRLSIGIEDADDLIAFFTWIGNVDLNGFPPKPDLKQ